MSMTKEETKYTVFTKDGGHQDSDPECGRTVPELIAWLVDNGCVPVAWSEGTPGRYTEYLAFRAEALASNRLIEFKDGRYVARGVPVEDKGEQQTHFRIGGVYRDNSGRKYRLYPASAAPSARHDDKVAAWAKGIKDSGEYAQGFRSLTDGRDLSDYAHVGGNRDLLPGELHQINGEWVPVEDKPAESLAALIRKVLDPVYIGIDYARDALHPADAAMIARDGPAKAAHGEGCGVTSAPKPAAPTAKPSPFSRFRSPDLIASTHQADPRNGSALLRD